MNQCGLCFLRLVEALTHLGNGTVGTFGDCNKTYVIVEVALDDIHFSPMYTFFLQAPQIMCIPFQCKRESTH